MRYQFVIVPLLFPIGCAVKTMYDFRNSQDLRYFKIFKDVRPQEPESEPKSEIQKTAEKVEAITIDEKGIPEVKVSNQQNVKGTNRIVQANLKENKDPSSKKGEYVDLQEKVLMGAQVGLCAWIMTCTCYFHPRKDDDFSARMYATMASSLVFSFIFSLLPIKK